MQHIVAFCFEYYKGIVHLAITTEKYILFQNISNNNLVIQSISNTKPASGVWTLSGIDSLEVKRAVSVYYELFFALRKKHISL